MLANRDPAAARRILEQLEKKTPEAKDAPRLDELRVVLAWRARDFAAVKRLAARMAEKTTGPDMGILRSVALAHQADAAIELGDFEAARRALLESRRLGIEHGDRDVEASSHVQEAVLEQRRGALDACAAATARAIAIIDEVGIGRQRGRAMMVQAACQVLAGNAREGRVTAEAALALAKKPVQQIAPSTWLGVIAERDGRLEEAAGHYRRAIALAEQEKGAPPMGMGARLGLSRVLRDQGDLAGARRSLEKIPVSTNDPFHPHVLLERGWLAFDSGDAQEAATHAAGAAAGFARLHNADVEACARALWARVLLATHEDADADKAREVLDSAVDRARTSQAADLGSQVAIAAGQLLFAEEEPGEARTMLLHAQAEARRRRLPRLELEARLALAEAEARHGGKPGAAGRLASLAGDARAKGYALLAERAKKLATAQN